MRLLVDASVRESMDTFLIGLIWDADPADDRAPAGGGGFFPPATDCWHPRVLLVCPPEAVPGKARAWARVKSHLEELREPFAAECVTTQAARRGWGLGGLPWYCNGACRGVSSRPLSVAPGQLSACGCTAGLAGPPDRARPPPYRRGWPAGRFFPGLHGDLVLERVLGAEETAGWFNKVAPTKG